MSERMKELLENDDITHNIAEMWDDCIRPILDEQQRIMVFQDKPCTSKELKGATTLYKALEKFASAGKESLKKNKK